LEGKTVVEIDIDTARAESKEEEPGTENDCTAVAVEQVSSPEDPEFTEVVSGIELNFPELQKVKEVVRELLSQYTGKLVEGVVLTVAQDLLLEVNALKHDGVIQSLSSVSVDVLDDELEVNLGIIFSEEKEAQLTLVVRGVVPKNDISETAEN
jgi:hypothetical protein